MEKASGKFCPAPEVSRYPPGCDVDGVFISFAQPAEPFEVIMDQIASEEATSVRQPQHKFLRVPSKAEIYLQSGLAGLFVALLSLLVEELMGEPHVHLSLVNAADQLVAGVITAGCIFALRYNSRKRRILDRQRFELIAASTQQIRDALQLITDTAAPGTQHQQIVIYAVDHIEWVLQEVLPTVHQDPKEVRARMKQYE